MFLAHSDTRAAVIVAKKKKKKSQNGMWICTVVEAAMDWVLLCDVTLKSLILSVDFNVEMWALYIHHRPW